MRRHSTSSLETAVLVHRVESSPICATERWPMVVAMLRTSARSQNLQQTRSAVRDGNIATLSFYGSTYSKPRITFTPVETTTNRAERQLLPDASSTPTAAQSRRCGAPTLEENLSFPFIDIGGKVHAQHEPVPRDRRSKVTASTTSANSVGDNTNHHRRATSILRPHPWSSTSAALLVTNPRPPAAR